MLCDLEWHQDRAAASRQEKELQQPPSPLCDASPAYLQEYVEKIKDEEAYKAVEKNLSGSRPRELFDDVIEDAEKDFEKDRTVLKVRLAADLSHDEAPGPLRGC
jgi:hypothetical protein